MEMISLGYDYSEGPTSEWFGDYLEKNSSPSWKKLETEINGQFGGYSNMTEASRALVGFSQKRVESIVALVGQVFSYSKGGFLARSDLQ